MSHTADGSVGVVAHREKLSPDAAAALRAALSDSGAKVTWVDIDKGSAATKAARRLMHHGAAHVVACGGDGTVRATAQALLGTGVPLSVVPAGTANLFCAGLGLPNEIDDIVGAISHGADRSLDVGRCNGQAFVIMAGMGLDATMIDGADASKPRLGRVAYLVAGTKAARSADCFPMRVKVDGEELYRGEASCVLVANIGRVMGGIDAVPSAHPDDGVLNVAIVTAAGVGQWSSLVWHAIRGDQAATGLVHLGAGTRVSVKLDKKRRFELDGGTKGKAQRLDIDLVPGGLVVRMPVPA